VQGSRVHVTSGKFQGCSGTVLSKTIGTYVKVKFLPDSSFPDTVATLHINKLEASVIEKQSDLSNIEADARLLKTLFDSYSYRHILLANDTQTRMTSVPFPSQVEPPVETPVESAPSNFCFCGNTGMGKFVECRSEAKCKSVRFFHMSCVGYDESRNTKKQKPFLCQECQKSDRGRGIKEKPNPNHFLEGQQFYRKSYSRHRSPIYSLLYQQPKSPMNIYQPPLSSCPPTSSLPPPPQVPLFPSFPKQPHRIMGPPHRTLSLPPCPKITVRPYWDPNNRPEDKISNL
jgi:hypothetical protein